MITTQLYQRDSYLTKYIKNVAIYLRKSRGEIEKDLENHRFVLHEICKNNNWSFVEYEEIGTGDTIADRTEIKRLLNDIREGLYDAVLVFDYDRLGRGDASDQDTIIKTLRMSDTLVVQANPFQILDPNDERDEETMEFKGFLARREYKMITKRLATGRKIRARQGFWSITYAPYGYEIDKETKRLKIVESEAKIIRFMVEEYLNGESFQSIAWKLNKQNIPSPSDGKWHGNTIRYILTNEVYLGWVISNKSQRKKITLNQNEVIYEVKRLPKDEWVIVKGAHEPIITIEEHQKIKELIRHKAKHHLGGNINPLSGLVKCGKCGTTMIMQKVNKHRIDVKACQNCGNKGGDTKLIIDLILNRLEDLESMIKEELNKEDNNLFTQEILNQISELEKELQKNQMALERIEELYEEGEYDKDKYLRKKDKRNKKIAELEEEIHLLKNKINNFSNVKNQERLNEFQVFKEILKSNKDPVILNDTFKSIIHSIIWTREKYDEVKIRVNFL